MFQNKQALTAEQVYNRLTALCARGEHCAYDLDQKMWRWGMADADERQRVIDRLADERYVDHRRYARAFVSDKLAFNGWGRRRIALELQARRIEKDVISEALAAIDEEEYARRLRDFVQTQWQRLLRDDADDRTRWQKLMQAAVRRGFESDLVSRALSELTRCDDCD